ncbi:phosphate signaling complex protein PhoU [Virgisporangium ochraceum]|uniref:Phosphate-specific transport system accessory protein PhoU n=1 Tax=Virgisporangium ochraceum TaxID=65505 RepID=A0A8J4EGV6_9ACTN|nr:phosphate signaling complex protein PhoU [Virgisporangium ochraceum]GIJ71547.1 phosphate transport system regulatory protein PhoU [Virgisporangium ochraceum]
MRNEFQADLRAVNDLLVTMTTAVQIAMADATTALLAADRDLAAAVAGRDADVNALRDRVEDLVLVTIARQAPVAGDLRALFVAAQVATDVERMGDLAAHVARMTLRYHPRPTVPADLRALFVRIGRAADGMAAKAVQVLAEPDAATAAELERDDDLMDGLHQELLTAILDRKPPLDVATGVQLVLLARFYERFADHAVNAGHRTVFRLTGTTVH